MRPNIVYLHSHDTGRYIQPYGFAVPTPRLQAFAESGVLFRRAFSAAPTCSPSRAALLTGTNPHTSGMLGLAHRGFRLHNPNHLLPHTLRASGYYTGLAGIQHVLPESDLSGGGWDFVREKNQNAVAETARRFLLAAPRNRPFFLDAGFFETHRKGRAFGGNPTNGDAVVGDARYVMPPVGLPDTPDVRRDWADYCQSAARLDAGMGRVLDALKETGRENETIVLVTTDHGVAFPNMKCSLTDRGTGVSLLLRAPNGIGGGRVIDALVSHLDVFPTLCDLAEIEAPTWLEGVSLGPLLRGKTNAPVRSAVFSEVTFHAAYEPKRSVRTERWRYIRNYGPRQTPVLPNCDDGLSKDVWVTAGWRDRVVPREELYDLLFDPGETANRANDPACASVRADLAARLTKWMGQTRDPLRDAPNGIVPVPLGAKINDASGTSPTETPR